MFDDLGTTPDEVADALRTFGIQGVRNTVRFLNPIVRYVHGRQTGVYGIDIIQGDRLRIEFANSVVIEVEVPGPVLGFLERFHQGQYPDLEMSAGPE